MCKLFIVICERKFIIIRNYIIILFFRRKLRSIYSVFFLNCFNVSMFILKCHSIFGTCRSWLCYKKNFRRIIRDIVFHINFISLNYKIVSIFRNSRSALLRNILLLLFFLVCKNYSNILFVFSFFYKEAYGVHKILGFIIVVKI